MPVTIGSLSQESGVNLETIRYYERTGLLQAPIRAANGYRHYDEQAIKRLRFIRRGRELGFSIEEIKTLLSLADHPEQPCTEADRLAREHLQAVEERIRDLQAMREVLLKLVDCNSPSAEHCRLIETLDQRDCCQQGT
ncbi:MerR family transcriptional regulator [Parachitinimonas caeni]|uniref:Helix-turn-helix domain-containing protein n=1 Tax=Parachitinimonas caeni TaxID=3031301 RepID=A0ABT7DX12_9NEIS|nr:helix-turn-helix domain-containing protein [Parachitinimonas caeni]MDK2124609.1 helix-turn-helix domain-containing protein [Parachitinimonas caeni]